MFRKAKPLELEVDGDVKGAPAGARPPPANTYLLPRWQQILHYVMHAVSLLLIVLLIVAIALVETDARDEGDDGAANKILGAFRLQVDGAVTTACSESELRIAMCQSSVGSTKSDASCVVVAAAVSVCAGGSAGAGAAAPSPIPVAVGVA